MYFDLVSIQIYFCTPNSLINLNRGRIELSFLIMLDNTVTNYMFIDILMNHLLSGLNESTNRVQRATGRASPLWKLVGIFSSFLAVVISTRKFTARVSVQISSTF